mgnify:CR=1 FL=1
MNQLVEQTSSTDDRMDPLVVEILERVTVGDFGRMSERVSERAMRATDNRSRPASGAMSPAGEWASRIMATSVPPFPSPH